MRAVVIAERAGRIRAGRAEDLDAQTVLTIRVPQARTRCPGCCSCGDASATDTSCCARAPDDQRVRGSMTATLLHRLRERARIGHRAARVVVVHSERVAVFGRVLLKQKAGHRAPSRSSAAVPACSRRPSRRPVGSNRRDRSSSGNTVALHVRLTVVCPVGAGCRVDDERSTALLTVRFERTPTCPRFDSFAFRLAAKVAARPTASQSGP